MSIEPSDKRSTPADRQNDPRNLQLMAAARRKYADAKAVHSLRSIGTLVFALAAPLVLVFWADAGPVLGALAGLWLLFSRVVLAPLEQSIIRDAVVIQEEFDCDVLDLHWNAALGRRCAPETIAAAARRWKQDAAVRDWYPPTPGATGVRSTLICQRSSAVWGRRLHSEYAWLIGVAGVIWLAAGIVLAIARSTSLSTYLIVVLLPSLPALLDAIDLVQSHRLTATSKRDIETATDEALEVDGEPDHLAEQARTTQDRVFQLRRDAPIISQVWYRLRRASYEADMATAATRLSESQA